MNMNMNNLLDTKQEIQKSFNNLALQMCTFLGNKVPDSHFGTYSGTIKSFIEERPSEPLAMFIKYVYSNDDYRENILKGDDAYFMGQPYDKLTDDSTEIFQIKDVWKKLDDNSKKYIKQVFVLLVKKTELYVEVLTDINRSKGSKHQK